MSASTYAHKKLCAPTFAPTNAAPLVTNPSGKKTCIRLIQIHNVSDTPVTVKLFTVPGSGGVAGVVSDIDRWYTELVEAGKTREFEYQGQGLYLDTAGDSLQVQASAVNAITCHVFGGQEG